MYLCQSPAAPNAGLWIQISKFARLQGLMMTPFQLGGVEEHFDYGQLTDEAIGLLHVACTKQS